MLLEEPEESLLPDVSGDDAELDPVDDSVDESDVEFEDEPAEAPDVDEDPDVPDEEVPVCRLGVPVDPCGATGVNRRLGSISVDDPAPVCRRWVDCDDDELEDEDDELSVLRRPACGGLELPLDDEAPEELVEPD